MIQLKTTKNFAGLAYRRAYEGSKYRTKKKQEVITSLCSDVVLSNGKMYIKAEADTHLIFSEYSSFAYPENKFVSVTSSLFDYLISVLNVIFLLCLGLSP